MDLNLCPFARHELIEHGVRFTVSEATSEEQSLSALDAELGFLNNDESIETTLLIHPHVLQNFYDYNEFLNRAEDLLVQMNLSELNFPAKIRAFLTSHRNPNYKCRELN